jgi:hypothetical protein
MFILVRMVVLREVVLLLSKLLRMLVTRSHNLTAMTGKGGSWRSEKTDLLVQAASVWAVEVLLVVAEGLAVGSEAVVVALEVGVALVMEEAVAVAAVGSAAELELELELAALGEGLQWTTVLPYLLTSSPTTPQVGARGTV